jgi:hypothetical protein
VFFVRDLLELWNCGIVEQKSRNTRPEEFEDSWPRVFEMEGMLCRIERFGFKRGSGTRLRDGLLAFLGDEEIRAQEVETFDLDLNNLNSK